MDRLPLEPHDNVDPEALLDQLEKQRNNELRQAESRRLEQIAVLKQLLKAESLRADLFAVLRELVPLVKTPEFRGQSPSSTKPRHTWVLLFSDLQLGQKTSLEASNHVFEQSTEVAKEQVALLMRQLERLYRQESMGKDIVELAILDLGDNHEGDALRVSQSRKVDSPVGIQFVDCFDLTSELILHALGLFPNVRYRRVGGNHDRFSPKPGTAGLGELDMRDTFAWVGGEMLRRMFKSAIEAERLNFQNHESWFGADIIAGHKFVYEHGASFRASTGSYGGISYYSIANAAAGYLRMLDGADIVAFGHFHQPMVLPIRGGWEWQVINGAFPPSSEFVQSRYKGFGRPTQILLDFENDSGLVNTHMLYLNTEHMIRPGDFWRRIEEQTHAK